MAFIYAILTGLSRVLIGQGWVNRIIIYGLLSGLILIVELIAGKVSNALIAIPLAIGFLSLKEKWQLKDRVIRFIPNVIVAEFVIGLAGGFVIGFILSVINKLL